MLDSILSELMSRLPFCVVLYLFFSYLIWAKVFNNNHTHIKKVDGILEILSLFFVIFTMIPGFFFTIYSISALVNINFNLPFGLNILSKLVSLFMILVIPLFLVYFTNMNLSRNRFRKLMGSVIYIAISGVSLLLGFWLAIRKIPSLNISVGVLFFLTLVYTLISITILYNVFRCKFKIGFLGVIILFILIFVIIFLMGLGLPKITLDSESTVRYDIYGMLSQEEVYAFAVKEKQYNLSRLPTVSTVPQMSFDLQGFDIFSDKGVSNFEVRIGQTNGKSTKIIEKISSINNLEISPLTLSGFKKAELFRHYLILLFNKKEVKSSNINKIILSGYAHTNITSNDFSYSDNSESVICNLNSCQISINVTNNLLLPVHFLRYPSFLLLNIKHFDNCVFKNLNLDTSVGNLDYTCEGKVCEGIIYSTDSGYAIVGYFEIRIEEDNVHLNNLNLNSPQDLKLLAQIDCSAD